MDRAKVELDDLFCDALERTSPAERAAYLDQVCGDDRELRRRIERLLEAHADADSFLAARPAVGKATGAGIGEAAGTIIGPYKLLEQIGQGGFGVVFLAEQQQPVRRKVALKVLKPGMDTKQVVARFEAERQALALMDHPHIARVLDAGATDASRPYFVMELVRGVPITEFCDDNRLTPRERLELFLTVCQAVQHAHQKGIIHRDLKPSNVLVTLHDGTPWVKVIDFGIAKALGQERLTDKTLFTGFAQMIGTPLYMSPEQAEMSGQDVDTRTDIYSLGVLLYELLTGTTPFDKERLKQASYDEIRRIIRREGLKVFFYRTEAEARSMLGQNLDERLSKIYCNGARLVIPVLSRRYATEGATKREWEAITRRRERDPDEPFLVPVSTANALSPELAIPAYEYIGEDAWVPEAGIGIRRVIRTVLQRLGRRPWLMSLFLIAVLVTAAGSVAIRWFWIGTVSFDARTVAGLVIGLALAWWVLFLAVPRWFPDLVYQPRGRAARFYQSLYLSVLIDRVALVGVLALAGIAHTMLPQWQTQVQTAIQDWLGNEPDHRVSALRFFTYRCGRQEALDTWALILVSESNYSGRDRGKALDMVCKLKDDQTQVASLYYSVRDVSGWLRQLGEDGRFNLNGSNSLSALSGIDATGLDLQRTDLSRLSLAGVETRLTDAHLTQSRLVSCWIQAANLDRVDARWCDLSKTQFAGVSGNRAGFGGALFTGCGFLGCNLSDVDFSRSDLTGATFYCCKLDQADFTNAYLTGVRFEDCDLTGAVFTNPDVRQVGVWGDLAGVSFIRCRMGGVTIIGADLEAKARDFVRVGVPDMASGKEVTVNTRYGAGNRPDRNEPRASLRVPGATFIDCQFRYESRGRGQSGSGIDWSGTRTRGVLMDAKTFNGMTKGERTAFLQGGFDETTISRPRQDQGSPEQQHSELKERTWENLSGLLSRMYKAASESR